MENPTIGLALLAGLLSFISPCVLPLVPAYIGYMGGRMTRTVAISTGGAYKEKNDTSAFARANMLLHALVFVAGFTLVFVALGIATTALVSVAGGAATLLTDLIARLGGVIIIALGLHYMGIIPALFQRIKQNSHRIGYVGTALVVVLVNLLLAWAFIEIIIALPVIAAFSLFVILRTLAMGPQQFWLDLIERIEVLLYTDTRGDMQPTGREGLAGSFVMGIVFSAGWTPCIGPLYGAILNLAWSTGDVGSAVPLLSAYSLGLGVPFILAALALDSVQGLMRRLQPHMRKIELVSGGLLVMIGVLVASGQLASLSQNLGTQFTDLSFRVEECGVGFADGQLRVEHLGSCLGGTLHLVAINQSANANFDVDATEMVEEQFVFHIDAQTAIDVDVTRLTDGLQPIFTLYNPENQAIASSDTLYWLPGDEDDTALAMNNIVLDAAGIYRLVVTGDTSNVIDDDTARVRVKVVETRGDVQSGTVAGTAAGNVADVVALDSPAADEN